jgi:hypothetical protein
MSLSLNRLAFPAQHADRQERRRLAGLLPQPGGFEGVLNLLTRLSRAEYHHRDVNPFEHDVALDLSTDQAEGVAAHA